MRYACDWTAATVPQGRRTGYTERLVRIKTRAIAKLCHTFATRLLRRFIARKLRRVLITAVPRTINGINFFFFPFFFGHIFCRNDPRGPLPRSRLFVLFFLFSFFLNPLKSTIVDLNDVSESQKEIPEIRGKLQKLQVDIA